jgi:rubrerythrin
VGKYDYADLRRRYEALAEAALGHANKVVELQGELQVANEANEALARLLEVTKENLQRVATDFNTRNQHCADELRLAKAKLRAHEAAA